MYKAVLEFFEKRTIAVIGCIIVAFAPFYVSFVKRLWMQPLQLMAVAWFVYIMAYSKKLECITIVLQLVAATSFAMLVMVSSPIFCLFPAIIAFIQIRNNRWPSQYKRLRNHGKYYYQ